MNTGAKVKDGEADSNPSAPYDKTHGRHKHVPVANPEINHSRMAGQQRVYRCNLKIYHLQLLSTVRRPNNAASQTHIWVCEAGGCSVFRHALA